LQQLDELHDGKQSDVDDLQHLLDDDEQHFFFFLPQFMLISTTAAMTKPRMTSRKKIITP
jgi:hypothetical protein